MTNIFVDPCIDNKGSGCEKNIATDHFCCQFAVPNHTDTSLYITKGCVEVRKQP
ncbi:hypothetical protein V1503_23295 [Bacillus sp. SCS-151]|uniref:hypothetical protein n=1 Tax=Nanhaiella sioensis TaxID=3115293 RepID=UPI003978FA25